MNKKKILIISFDAVDGNDLDFLCTLPNFASIIKESSYSKEVETIYPSLTYPAHTSIVTGMKPKNHGVTNNIKIQPNRCNSSDWFWRQKEVKAESLFDVAKRNGLTHQFYGLLAVNQILNIICQKFLQIENGKTKF